MYDHQEADRVPVTDSPWNATIERWRREGMPEGVDYVDFFDLDRVAFFAPDSSPRYEERVIEETDSYVVHTTKWGVTLRNWKHAASTRNSSISPSRIPIPGARPGPGWFPRATGSTGTC